MTAKFALDGYKPLLVVLPDSHAEAVLLATFIRSDSNVFYVRVERHADGSIKALTFRAETAE